MKTKSKLLKIDPPYCLDIYCIVCKKKNKGEMIHRQIKDDFCFLRTNGRSVKVFLELDLTYVYGYALVMIKNECNVM